MMSRRIFIAALILFAAASLAALLLPPVPAAVIPPAASGPTAATVYAGERAAKLESHVRYLADDSLEGRLVGTPGIEEAAHYIAGEFQTSGLKPLADSSYFQEFALSFGVHLTSPPAMSIGGRELSAGEEFQVLPISGSRLVEGLTAFITRTEHNQVPLEVPRDLKGYIVFCFVHPHLEEERWTLTRRDGLLEYMEAIASQVAGFGASAIVFVNGSPDSLRDGLHIFAMKSKFDRVGIPALEISGSVLEEALMFEGITVKRLLTSQEPREDQAFFMVEGPTCRMDVSIEDRTVKVFNVIGLVVGSSRPDEYIILGAHYDHLGYGDVASTTPWRREIHNGADDNASGVAALIETAREIAAAGDVGRSVIFIAFTAEELGALGSQYYRDHPLRPLDKTIAMVNLDTVGRLDNDQLIVFGARSATEFESLLVAVNEAHDLDLAPKKEIFGYSDQNAFVEAGIPSLHFFTGAYEDYHSPDDDWQNLNYEGLDAVTDFVTDFVVAVANADTRPTPLGGLGRPPEMTGSRGRGAHLGIVPDFAHSGTGVKIKGTVPRSPAETAGLIEGDVLVAMDGEHLSELRDLMISLSKHAPGDIVEIEVRRGSRTMLIPVELGTRRSDDQQDRPQEQEDKQEPARD